MKRQISVTGALFSILFLIIISGCGEQADQVQTDTDDTIQEQVVDLSIEVPLLRVGHCKHDHHSAVFVSALRGERMNELYGIYLEPLGESYYALVENGQKVVEIEFVQSQGAINVPNNMVAGLFEIGFGGVIPFAASADKGSGVKIISPLHSRGDMLVVSIDNDAVNDWDSFIEWVNTSEEPLIIGFKSPKAVALLIFESALTEAGISWSMQGNPEPDSKILLFNAQGQPNLNPALQNGTVDAYVSNNPACALAEHNGIGKCVAELSDLPPGDFRNHPCCAIAATETAIAEKSLEIAASLRLFAAATDYINNNPEDAAVVAAEWIGNPVEVEEISMATSRYSMEVSLDWLENMVVILDNMRNLGAFTGPLTEKDDEVNACFLYDFSLMPENLR
ncbi:MAG: ABC transporter substrate-binding protein [Candidatus Fermentibacteraceae bacterium]|nr:ABC transporter substrate-binding protein [Candidatus Fermentibacteraceae bacterium]